MRWKAEPYQWEPVHRRHQGTEEREMCLPDENPTRAASPCSATKSISHSLTSLPLWCHSFIRFPRSHGNSAAWSCSFFYICLSLSLFLRPSPSPDPSEPSPPTPSEGVQLHPHPHTHPPPYSLLSHRWCKKRVGGYKTQKGETPRFTSCCEHALKSLWSNRDTFVKAAHKDRTVRQRELEGRRNRAWIGVPGNLLFRREPAVSFAHRHTEKQHIAESKCWCTDVYVCNSHSDAHTHKHLAQQCSVRWWIINDHHHNYYGASLLIIPVLTLEKGGGKSGHWETNHTHTLIHTSTWSHLLYSIISRPLLQSTFIFPASPLFPTSTGFRCSSLPHLNHFTQHSYQSPPCCFHILNLPSAPPFIFTSRTERACRKAFNHPDEEGKDKNGKRKTHKGKKNQNTYLSDSHWVRRIWSGVGHRTQKQR